MTHQYQLTFNPDFKLPLNYTIQPVTWAIQSALGIILSWPDPKALVEFALQRKGYLNFNSMVGIEYPKNPEKQGMIRRLHGMFHPTKKVKLRKYYMPESQYLGILAALMRAHHWEPEVKMLEGILPLEPIAMTYSPDIYCLVNYKIVPFHYDAHVSLGMILAGKDLAQSQRLGLARQGFEVFGSDGLPNHKLSYMPDGQLKLAMPNGQDYVIPEEVYLSILEQLLQLHGDTVCLNKEKGHSTNESIDKLICLFCSELMERELWTHQAHLIVATVILYEQGLSEGTALIKRLIRRNNEVMGIANTENSGYHETLTQFYIQEIDKRLRSETFGDKYAAVTAVLQSEIAQRDYPLRFYAKERLLSVHARQNYVASGESTP